LIYYSHNKKTILLIIEDWGIEGRNDKMNHDDDEIAYATI